MTVKPLHSPQRSPRRRNPYAVVLRRLGRKVKPSAKLYSRKGRSQDRPFASWEGGDPHRPQARLPAAAGHRR